METQSEKISKRALCAIRTRRLSKMQEQNWQKHFAEHPEQLLPGAEVKRTVPLEEAELSAQIIGSDLF